MKVIIPAAGIGQRFLDAGYKQPKPLLLADGIPFARHVANMFSPSDDFVFVCNEDHLKSTEMCSIVESVGHVVSIKPHTLGPVHSVLAASEFIEDDEPVAVCYCDFYEWWDYQHFKGAVNKSGCDAAVTAYTGFHPHLLGNGLYASMKVENGWMLECREKHSFTENKMDSFHQTGKFYFSSGSLMKRFFNDVKERNIVVNGEFYISVATQAMVEAGLKVMVYPVEHFLQWGTPHDLEEYMQWSGYFSGKNGLPEAFDERTMRYWESFFRKCPWHPYGKGGNDDKRRPS